MNVEQNMDTNNDVANPAVAEVAITDVKHYYIDAEGNRVEIPFDVEDGQTYSDGETSSEETTVYIAADGKDHVVTIH